MKDINSNLNAYSLTEQLTANFYNWERLGRGWQVWECPVELEPPFGHFYHRQIPDVQPLLDDGRKPGLFEKAIKNYKTPSQKDNTHNNIDTFLDLEPQAFTGQSDLKEITMSLSSKQKISIDSVEQFLLNLSYSSSPISFEVIGTIDSIRIQLACRESDFPQLKQQLQAFFPDIVANEENDLLLNLWDDEQETVIVDFALSQEFMRPLRTLRKSDNDPLIGIIGALEDLGEDEIGVFQILFQGVHNPWPDSIMRSVVNCEGNSFFANAPEMVGLAKEKVSKPLFAAVIRVIAQSPWTHRAWEIARTLGTGLKQLANPNSNELVPLTNEGYDDSVHISDVLLRQSHRSGMLLNCEELVSLVHPPSDSVRSQKLIRELKKTKALPSIALGNNMVLGENLHQGNKTDVTLSNEQRLRHMYVIGATGTGKTTLLLNMIIQDINSGVGVAVFDPHGDLIDRICGHIPEERLKDVVLLDPSDLEHPVGLNILSSHSEIEKNVLSSDLVAVFRRFTSSWGDQMTTVLGNAILAFIESEKGGTLLDLRRFLVEAGFRKSFLETVNDHDVRYFWQKEFPLLRGNPQASILTRLSTFLRPKLIRNMVAQKEGINFQDILENKKIFLVKLSQGLIGEENAYILGSFIVSKIHQVTMARQALKQDERKNFYLYLDEFQNFITPSMASILSSSRKYNLGLVLAHQDLRQLWNQDTEVANAAISNPFIRVCFRMGDFDAKKLEDGFSSFDATDLQNLGIGEAICRIERNEYDFNLKTLLVPEIPPEIAKKKQTEIITLSRDKYGLKKDEVEKIIEDRLAPTPSTKQPQTTSEKVPQEKPIKRLDSPDKKELSNEEMVFIEFISQHPNMFITHIYKSLQLSGYKGDKIKERLIDQEMIIQEETRAGKKGRLAKILTLTDKGSLTLKKSPLAGKGGFAHKHLQMMFKEQAELYGWKATIEERIPGSIESVDVGLKKDDVRVAIEVSATTRAEQEVQNIRKCLEAGYDYIICVSEDENKLASIKKESRKSFNVRERERIKYFLPSNVKNFLSDVSSKGIVSKNSNVSEKIPKQKQLLDMNEASEFLGISKNTLYEWVVQKKVPFVKVGRLTKFKKEALDAWLEQRTHEERRDIF
jgi:excisionase family DNA binding protein